MASTHACSFFYTSPGGRFPRVELHPTTVDATSLTRSSATLYDWMYADDASSEDGGVLQVWLRIETGKGDDDHQPSLPASVSMPPYSLFAKCRLHVPCASGGGGTLVPHSTTILTDAAATTSQVLVVYACACMQKMSLHESVYRWRAHDDGQHHRYGHRLVHERERLLLTVDGGAPPYAVHAITEASAHVALFLLQTAQHSYAFHLRTGQAVRDGRVPSMAAVHMQWPPAHSPPRQYNFQHGCLAGDLVAFILRDAHRHTSTLHLAALQSSQRTRVLLEATTPTLNDADGALLAACGLAQRLVYTECTLTRTRSPVSPATEYTKVVLEARVESAVAGGTASAAEGVTWRPCGRQRYETVVRRLDGVGDVEWPVEPLVKVWSRPVAYTNSSLTAGDCRGFEGQRARVVVGARRALSCSTHNSTERVFSCMATWPRRRRCCLLETQAAPSGQLLRVVDEPVFLSASCRRMSAMWWSAPPSLVSRWVCVVTHCSVLEWLLLCMIASVISLLIRLSVRYGVVHQMWLCTRMRRAAVDASVTSRVKR